MIASRNPESTVAVFHSGLIQPSDQGAPDALLAHVGADDHADEPGRATVALGGAQLLVGVIYPDGAECLTISVNRDQRDRQVLPPGLAPRDFDVPSRGCIAVPHSCQRISSTASINSGWHARRSTVMLLVCRDAPIVAPASVTQEPASEAQATQGA